MRSPAALGVLTSTRKCRQRGVPVVGIKIRFVGGVCDPFFELNGVGGVPGDRPVCAKTSHFFDCAQRFEASLTGLVHPYGISRCDVMVHPDVM